MLGKPIKIQIIGQFMKTLACISWLVVGLSLVKSQVTIVPGKQETPQKDDERTHHTLPPKPAPSLAHKPKNNERMRNRQKPKPAPSLAQKTNSSTTAAPDSVIPMEPLAQPLN